MTQLWQGLYCFHNTIDTILPVLGGPQPSHKNTPAFLTRRLEPCHELSFFLVTMNSP